MKRDMVVHRLTLPQIVSETDVPLQIQSVGGAHIDGIADHLSVSAQSGTLNKGLVHPARASGSQRLLSEPTTAETIDMTAGYNPYSSHGEAGQRTTEITHTTPKTMLQPTQHADENIGEPIRANMGALCGVRQLR